MNCTINIIKTEKKSKIQSFLTFKEMADIIFVYETICSQTFSLIFYLCLLSVISGTPFPCQYESTNLFLLRL